MRRRRASGNAPIAPFNRSTDTMAMRVTRITLGSFRPVSGKSRSAGETISSTACRETAPLPCHAWLTQPRRSTMLRHPPAQWSSGNVPGETQQNPALRVAPTRANALAGWQWIGPWSFRFFDTCFLLCTLYEIQCRIKAYSGSVVVSNLRLRSLPRWCAVVLRRHCAAAPL